MENNIQDVQYNSEQGVIIRIQDDALSITGIGDIDMSTSASYVFNAAALVLSELEEEQRKEIVNKISQGAAEIAEILKNQNQTEME